MGTRRVTAAIEHVLTKVLNANDTMIAIDAARRAAEALLGFPLGKLAWLLEGRSDLVTGFNHSVRA